MRLTVLMLDLVVRRTVVNIMTIDTNTHKPKSILVIVTRNIFMLNIAPSKNTDLLRFVTFQPSSRQIVVKPRQGKRITNQNQAN